MNHTLQSYTPKERPLEYDSLTAREGCDAIGGNDYFGWRAYEQICVFRHDLTSRVFNQPDTVSYSVGPEIPGEVGLRPWNALWTVWQASGGLRMGKLGAIVPPSDSLGDPCLLYAGAKTTKVAHAFNDDALLAVAIQKSANLIELSRLTATSGILTKSFSGHSPVMVNISNLATSALTKWNLLVMYFKAERPTVLFGRFEQDGFTAEYILMPDLRVGVARLIGVEAQGRREVLRYRSPDGRDVTLTSPIYVVDASVNNLFALDYALDGGMAFNNVFPGDAGFDKCQLTLAMAGGIVYDGAQRPNAPNDPLPSEKAAIIASLAGGEVTNA